MASGLPVIAPRIERLTRIFRDGREGIFYDPAQPGSLAVAFERLADPSAPVRAWAPRRVIAPSSDSAGEATARRSIAPSGPHAMRILIATDAFPPVSGGSGWSTYELGAWPSCQRASSRRGRAVFGKPAAVLRRVRHHRIPGACAPCALCPQLFPKRASLSTTCRPISSKLIREERIDLIHAQHELTGPASVRAAKDDGHSVCRHSPGLLAAVLLERSRPLTRRLAHICPGCSPGAMMQCLPPRVGSAWPLTHPDDPVYACESPAEAEGSRRR